MENNEITNNGIGVKIWFELTSFTGNRVCNNTQYNVSNELDRNVSLVGNCFCESDSTVAEALLFDGYDDITRGLFNYALYDSTCTNVVQLVTKVLIPTGIDAKEELVVEVFPNPAGEVLHVRLPFSTEPVEARILNLQGVELMRSKVNGVATFDVSQLPKGIYFLQCVGAQSETRTWIKQ